MESLMELVAASFARHGLESRENHVATDAFEHPADRSSTVEPKLLSSHEALPAEPALVSALPDHNYRKTLQGDPAP
jgi:hypothetical protein